MPDPTGNTAELINNAFQKNSDAINALSSFIGTIADASGVVGGVLSILSLVQNQDAATQALLQNILNTIQSDFKQLQADQKASDIVNRLTNLTNQLSLAETAFQSLTADVGAQPPLSAGDRIAQIERCIQALNALMPTAVPDTIWNAPFADQIYWTDAGQNVVAGIDEGYGLKAPSADSNGLVFNYLYVLPAYLRTVAIFLSVAATLDPEYVTNYGTSVIQPVVDWLKTKHDAVLGGIVKLSPAGSWTTESLFFLCNGLLADVDAAGLGLLPPSGLGFLPIPTSGGLLAQIEYGAVEIFSGVSSMATFQLTFGTPPPAGSTTTNVVNGSSPDSGPFNKLQIRLEKKAKDVYLAVGLSWIWQTINKLNSILGNPQMPRPSFADWSFKRDVLPLANPPVVNGKVSLLTIAKFIKYTAPADIPAQSLFTSYGALLNV